MTRMPDVQNLYKVLRREAPVRPTLFELFMGDTVYTYFAGKWPETGCRIDETRYLIKAYAAAGYDYATVHGSAFRFKSRERHGKSTVSLNDGATITDRASFDAYEWPEVAEVSFDRLDVAGDLPGGMKLMVMGPGGVLENVIQLMGYDNLCLLIYDDPQLVHDVFENVGRRLLAYYEKALTYPSVGLMMSNDDWGFNTQTMLMPAHMREFVFPWHKKLVECGHAKGLPVILHSCGYFDEVMNDVIEMGYDGKHSYEDNILCVEDSYRKWHDRIAILGGIDLDFIVTKAPEEVYARSKAMLALGQTGYALGTGNSVPAYVPLENYLAMTRAALE